MGGAELGDAGAPDTAGASERASQPCGCSRRLALGAAHSASALSSGHRSDSSLRALLSSRARAPPAAPPPGQRSTRSDLTSLCWPLQFSRSLAAWAPLSSVFATHRSLYSSPLDPCRHSACFFPLLTSIFFFFLSFFNGKFIFI